jgi:hypothetical protein
MGCFSTRCLLTNIQICEGEEVVIIPLIFDPGYMDLRTILKPEGIYKPCGLPMFGTYDDYGSIKPHANDAGIIFNAELMHIEASKFLDSFHPSTKFEEKCLKLFIHDKDWKVPPSTSWVDASKEVEITLAMISKEAWDKMLPNGFRCPWQNLLDASHVKSAIVKINECLAEFKLTATAEDYRDTSYFAKLKPYSIEDKLKVPFTEGEEYSTRYICNDREGCDHAVVNKIRKLFTLMANDATKSFDTEINLFFSVIAMSAAMDARGFFWHPKQNIGGQHPDLDSLKEQKEWLEFTLKMVKERYKKRKADSY